MPDAPKDQRDRMKAHPSTGGGEGGAIARSEDLEWAPLLSRRARAQGTPSVALPTARTCAHGNQPMIAKPDPDGGQFDERKIDLGMFLVAGRDGAEVFNLAEEAPSLVAVTVEQSAEGDDGLAVRHWLDVGPSAAGSQFVAHGIWAKGPFCQQDLSVADPVQHVGRAALVMGLSGGGFQHSGQTIGIDTGMNLCRRAAARAPPASGLSGPSGGGFCAPFFALAPCW